MTFQKLFNLLEIGTLLFTICAAPWAKAAAADHPEKTAPQALPEKTAPQALPEKTAPQALPEKTAPQALPAPGTYEIDPRHSFVYFGASHHVVGLVRGRFDKVTGTFTVSRDLAACSADVTIDASSISTQVTERDEDLRGPAYFDVKMFPAMRYHGRGIRRVLGSSWPVNSRRQVNNLVNNLPHNVWIMDGSLTIHGVTKVVPLTFTFNGSFSDVEAGKPARVAFHGSAGTKRADFGMGARDKGEVAASPAPDVEIQIDVEADAKLPAQ